MASEFHLSLERNWYSLFDLEYLGLGVPILILQLRAYMLTAINMTY